MKTPPLTPRPPRRILAPVDLGSTAETVARFAAAFASAVGAEIALLHVWEPPPFSPPESLQVVVGNDRRSLADHVKAEAREELEKLLPGDPRVADRKALLGDPSSCILAEAVRGNYELVIIGTHGRTGLAHLALGSVAEKVLRRCPVPVLVVPCVARKGRSA
jgi:universal stress protein A